MSFQDELESRLGDIWRLAYEKYDKYLDTMGFIRDPNGGVTYNPAYYDPNELTPGTTGSSFGHRVVGDVDAETAKLQAFTADLLELLEKFRSYLYLDPTVDLTQRVSWLGIERGEPPSVGQPGARTVLQLLRYADVTWMHPVLDLVEDGDWRGDAASAFTENYLLPFRLAVERHRACTTLITVAVQAFHDMAIKAQRDILTIADHCILRLGDMTVPEELSVFDNIVLDALGLVTGIGTVLDLVQLGRDIHSAFAGGNGEQRAPVRILVARGSAPEIIQSTWDALVALDQRMADQDSVMVGGLAADMESTDALAHPGLRLPRPAVADSPDGFSELAIDDAPGVPLTESPVVTAIVELYQAGFVNLPSAAFCYQEATAKLEQVRLPSWVHQMLPLTAPVFEEARLTLKQVFQDTARDLADIGENMVTAATSYQLADEANAEALRRIGEIEPPTLDRVRPGPGETVPV
ncbi:MAG TPA: hypothetical protein VIL37_11375 [Natronosporangium sp.]